MPSRSERSPLVFPVTVAPTDTTAAGNNTKTTVETIAVRAGFLLAVEYIGMGCESTATACGVYLDGIDPGTLQTIERQFSGHGNLALFFHTPILLQGTVTVSVGHHSGGAGNAETLAFLGGYIAPVDYFQARLPQFLVGAL